ERAEPNMMPRDGIVLCARHKPRRFVIEREVLRLHGQQASERLDDRAANPLWYTFVDFGPAKSRIHRIAGEEFITAVAAERNGHVLSREPREQIRRHKRWIAKRFIHPRPDLTHEICGKVRAQTFFVMI